MFSPEAIMMLSIALVLDTVGELIPYVSDGIGLVIIGGWILFRSQQKIQGPKRQVIKKSGKNLKVKVKKIRKWVRPLCIVGEFIPVISILPFWTLLVWRELKNK